jgi:signal transduction histidine kinase
MTRAPAGDEVTIRRATRRISLQISVVVTVVVFGLVAVAFLVVLHSQHQADDRLLSGSIAEADDVVDPPAGVWLVERHGSRQSTTRGMPSGLPDQQVIDQVAADQTARTTDFTAHGREYRVRTQALADGGVIQALLDLSADHAERDRLVAACLICGAAGLLASAAVGVWLGRRAVAPLTEALALQRRFVADAGHELRTPLTLLSTRAQLISQSFDGDLDQAAAKSDVDELVADAGHLTDILDDLLVAADPRTTADDELVDLSTLVTHVVMSVCPLADDRGVTVIWTADDERLPFVAGSRASLRRAMTALLDNAVRHANTEVCVSIEQRGGALVIDVADDGPGIAADVRTTLFDRFTSSTSDSHTESPRRYGLGLALVSEVAAQHGGAVSTVDTDRGGATLRLLLPAAPGLASTSGDGVRGGTS